MSKYRLGIDLGTTFSVVSVFDPQTGESKVLPLDDGARNEEEAKLFPSAIQWSNSENGFVFGRKAYRAFQHGKADVVNAFKRTMGHNERIYALNNTLYTSEELSEMLLRRMRERACAVLGSDDLDTAVITVPAYFDPEQKRATRDAGIRAGFKNIIRVVNEPTAAAITYCSRRWHNGKIIMLFDLGGGTFDVTLCRMTHGYSLDVLASEGDSRLGGKDWDESLARLIIADLEQQGADVNDSNLMSKVYGSAEDLKKMLSELSSVTETFDQDGSEYTVTITREAMEEATAYQVDRCKAVMKRVLETARKCAKGCSNLSWHDVEQVLLVGGSSRLPQVPEMIKQVTGIEPERSGLDPDKVVSIGAAIDAHLSHGVSIPMVMSSAGAVPAAAQKQNNGALPMLEPGSRIGSSGSVTVMDLKDTTTHSLGTIAVSKDLKRYINDIVIPKGETIPAKNAIAEVFTCIPGKNDTMDVYTVQEKGEHLSPGDVTGWYEISGFPAGRHEVYVQYLFDDSGISDVQVRLSNGQPLKVVYRGLPLDMSWVLEPPKIQKNGAPKVVMLSVDVSGSMHDYDAGANRNEMRLTAAISAMNNFVDKLSCTGALIGVIATATRVQTVLEPTDDYDQVKRAISACASIDLGGGSSAHPFLNAKNTFDRMSGYERVLVILADGDWYGDAIPQSEQYAKEFKKRGYRSVAIGFGDAKTGFLQRISTDKSDAILTSGSQLTEAFGSIAVSLSDQNAKGGKAGTGRHKVETW